MAQGDACFRIEPASLVVWSTVGERFCHPIEDRPWIPVPLSSVPEASNAAHIVYACAALQLGPELTPVAYQLKTYITARITITSIDCR